MAIPWILCGVFHVAQHCQAQGATVPDGRVHVEGGRTTACSKEAHLQRTREIICVERRNTIKFPDVAKCVAGGDAPTGGHLSFRAIHEENILWDFLMIT